MTLGRPGARCDDCCRPLVLDHAICIDTWAYGDGWLTCLDVDLEVCWQANERGQTRVRNLQFRGR